MSNDMNVRKRSRIHAVFAALTAAGLKVRAIVTDKEKVAAARAGLALVICPVITFYLFDLYTHNPFIDMRPQVQILNMIFYVLTAILFTGIFAHCVIIASVDRRITAGNLHLSFAVGFTAFVYKRVIPVYNVFYGRF